MLMFGLSAINLRNYGDTRSETFLLVGFTITNFCDILKILFFKNTNKFFWLFPHE